MEQVIFLLAFVAVLGTLYFQRWLLDAILEAIQNFRGGPPTPMHPLPANDGDLLQRRSRRETSRPGGDSSSVYARISS